MEPSYGDKPEFMESIGTETVLNMATLKKHYDALGSYLHVLLLKKKLAGAKVDFKSTRDRCVVMVDYLTEVLDSPVWSTNFGIFATIECIKCGKPLRKRCPRGAEGIQVQCFECGATYKMHSDGDNEANFEPDQVELCCANKECRTAIYTWRSEIRPDIGWTCGVCRGHNAIRLAIYYEPNSSD